MESDLTTRLNAVPIRNGVIMLSGFGLKVGVDRRHLTVSALVLAVASLGFAPSRGIAEFTRMALPDCAGRPVVEPTSVTLACGDGNFSIEKIKWTGWGESFAAGVGTGKLNDCKPYCAAGHFHSYPMFLIATGRQSCPNSQIAYVKVVYAFVGRSPFPQDAPGTQDPSQRFPC